MLSPNPLASFSAHAENEGFYFSRYLLIFIAYFNTLWTSGKNKTSHSPVRAKKARGLWERIAPLCSLIEDFCLITRT